MLFNILDKNTFEIQKSFTLHFFVIFTNDFIHDKIMEQSDSIIQGLYTKHHRYEVTGRDTRIK